MFSRNRTPKSQAPDKTPFTVFNPHTLDLNNRNWNQDYYQVVSIDPSLKNLGFRIEKRFTNGKIESLVYCRKNFAPNIKKSDNLEPSIICDTYEVITQFLDQYINLYLNSHIIIIEKQLIQNYKAVRISQHIISYFLFHLKNAPLLPLIVEIDSKLKLRQLGAPRGMNERQNKKWLIEKAKELLQLHDDFASYQQLIKERKADDLSDVVCQSEAFFLYMKLPSTLPYKSANNKLMQLAEELIKKPNPILKIVELPEEDFDNFQSDIIDDNEELTDESESDDNAIVLEKK